MGFYAIAADSHTCRIDDEPTSFAHIENWFWHCSCRTMGWGRTLDEAIQYAREHVTEER